MSKPRRDAWAFLRYVDGECALAGVTLKLEARKRTRAGDLGYFSESHRELFVCVGNERWPMLLAHELAHLHQEREGRFSWPEDYSTIFAEWYGGKKRMTAKRVLTMCRNVQRAELDAERRALRFARSFNLSENVSEYIQGANMYVWRHEIARRLGRWPVYGDAETTVVGAMPTKLISQAQIGKPPSLMEALVSP